MERLIYILFDFGYSLIFGILGTLMFFLHMPKEKGMESYKKSRNVLGIAFLLMTAYCILRLFIPQHHGDYVDFWILTTITLVFTWLSYSSFLFLIETPRYLTKHFFIDGIIPTLLMLACGITGICFPQLEKVMTILFGCIFGIKSLYMFLLCVKEYRKCQREMDNFYDEGPDLKWMRTLLYLSFILSAATVLSFYVPAIHLIYYIAVPAIYGYMVFKILNYAPKKVDNLRKRNATLDVKPAEEKKVKVKDLSEKIGPLVEEWINEKKFCRENLNIKDVAMEMGTNHNYLSQYINNNLEMTFQVWLNKLRIEESKIMLTSKEKMTIEEIGARVGIPQNYNFSRWFKTVTDMTPFQYRKLHSSGRQ